MKQLLSGHYVFELKDIISPHYDVALWLYVSVQKRSLFHRYGHLFCRFFIRQTIKSTRCVIVIRNPQSLKEIRKLQYPGVWYLQISKSWVQILLLTQALKLTLMLEGNTDFDKANHTECQHQRQQARFSQITQYWHIRHIWPLICSIPRIFLQYVSNSPKCWQFKFFIGHRYKCQIWNFGYPRIYQKPWLFLQGYIVYWLRNLHNI